MSLRGGEAPEAIRPSNLIIQVSPIEGLEIQPAGSSLPWNCLSDAPSGSILGVTEHLVVHQLINAVLFGKSLDKLARKPFSSDHWLLRCTGQHLVLLARVYIALILDQSCRPAPVRGYGLLRPDFIRSRNDLTVMARGEATVCGYGFFAPTNRAQNDNRPANPHQAGEPAQTNRLS